MFFTNDHMPRWQLSLNIVFKPLAGLLAGKWLTYIVEVDPLKKGHLAQKEWQGQKLRGGSSTGEELEKGYGVGNMCKPVAIVYPAFLLKCRFCYFLQNGEAKKSGDNCHRKYHFLYVQIPRGKGAQGSTRVYQEAERVREKLGQEALL